MNGLRALRALFSLDMQQGVMWFLTLPSTMWRFALFDEVSWSQTVHAEFVVFQRGHHLVVHEGFETDTNIEGMFLVLA